MARRVAELLALMTFSVTATLACHHDDEVPPAPPLDFPTMDALTCGELLTAETLAANGDSLFVGNDPAQCAADGLSCPLAASALASDSCEPGEQPAGRCSTGQWRLTCTAAEPFTGLAGGGQGGASFRPNVGSAGRGGQRS